MEGKIKEKNKTSEKSQREPVTFGELNNNN